MSIIRFPLTIPADVPVAAHAEFKQNLDALKNVHDNTFLLAADHKLEHLNDDFYGEGIAPEAVHAEHFFSLAQNPAIGILATQFGLIARYGINYPLVQYVVKINSKTNIIPPQVVDPVSRAWYTIEQIVALKKNVPTIRGIGYTVYLGSDQEQLMLQEAAQLVTLAHAHGLVALLWVYPRGKHVDNPTSLRFTSGAAGVANALGADIVKLQLPPINAAQAAEIVKIAVAAAGNTSIIASGGSKIDSAELLETIAFYQQHGIHGAAVGRNLYQRSFHQAIELATSIRQLL